MTIIINADPMHPTIAEVDLGAIRRNVSRTCEKVRPAQVMAVVKANGYGHGAVQAARAALEGGATRLGVAHPREGVQLREAGIRAPIQVFGGFFPEQIETFLAAGLEFTLTDLALAQELSKVAVRRQRQVPVHVKFDTGMGRVGFLWEEAVQVFLSLQKCEGLVFRGLMTHFATADERDKSFAREQLERFDAVVAASGRLRFQVQYIHAANSGAILDLPQAYFNLVRPGVMIYGNYPSTETTESVPLEPALRWVSRLVQVKRVRAGQTVSYGATWRAARDTVIGTAPAGYADGYSRRLSNRMHAVVGGRRVPLVGRVCMDLIMFDLGPESSAQPGDEVVLLGRQGEAEVTMREFCDALDTIPYEITCMISSRVPRVYPDSPAV